MPGVPETSLPQFHAGLTPIGTIPGQLGTQMADKKQSGGLMKVLMRHAKMPGKVPPTRHKAKLRTGKRQKHRGIEADSMVHFGTGKFY